MDKKIEEVMELSNEEKIWLGEVWKYIWDTGEVPSYREIRIRTSEATGKAFNPRKIDHRLINRDANEVTLYGVFLLNAMDPVFPMAENIILKIKEMILADADKQEFTVKELSTELDIPEKEAAVSFALVSSVGRFWSSSGHSSDLDLFGFERFTVKGDDYFDSYFNFTTVEDLIDSQLLKEDDGNKVKFRRHIQKFVNMNFISDSRIIEIENIKSSKFDFSKLISLCDEINACYKGECYYAVAMLIRALVDHVPPIFDCLNFGQIVSNYEADGDKRSFKKSMNHLNQELRSISDSLIHSQIRKAEITINENQIECRISLDKLLAEIVRVNKIEE